MDGHALPPRDLVFDDKANKWVKADDHTKAATDAEIETFNGLYDEWWQKEELIKSQILFSVHKPLNLALIGLENRMTGPVTAKVYWDFVVKWNQDHSELHLADCRRTILTKKLMDKNEMKEHLQSMTKLHVQLESMGSPMPESEFVQAIIVSLPEDYRHIIRSTVTSFRAIGQQIDVDSLQRVILEEYDHRLLTGLIQPSTNNDKDKNKRNSALASRHTGNGRGRGNNRGNNSGHGHGYRGRGGSRGRGRGHNCLNSKIECYNCHKFGHIAADCFGKGGGREGQGPHQRKNDSANAAESTNAGTSGNAAASTSTNHAFLSAESATVATKSRAQMHIVDTGATHHFTSDRASFITFSEITPEAIQAASNQQTSLLRATPSGGMVRFALVAGFGGLFFIKSSFIFV